MVQPVRRSDWKTPELMGLPITARLLSIFAHAAPPVSARALVKAQRWTPRRTHQGAPHRLCRRDAVQTQGNDDDENPNCNGCILSHAERCGRRRSAAQGAAA